ncbi:HDOD domain-containing protein [Marinomonas sp. A79]|uniref:HDOD domain-containing protein n=1 Tax=Marinomonas vulgaris TaxID=2823372 RepID=A0ABS5H8N1_9GAMM|nr:HDOD domain-containing protein [Marinomonas vulgaris]MBR7888053.1 HDOD domain-containing protein [Marinomonas vulgaris]
MESSAHLQSNETLCIVHLADHTGRLRVIFPKNHMLDMSAISRITKRRFEPMSYYQRAGDTLVKPNNLNTILAQSLLAGSTYSISSQAGAPPRDITSDELKTLFSGPLNRFEDISIPVKHIKRAATHHQDDDMQILQALGRFQSIRLKKRIEETLEIPPLPASSHRVIRLSNDKTAGTDDLCDVIALDPSLAAQVVSWAASPYYGAPGPIASVEDAIIRVLGFDVVMNLALGLSLSNAFSAADNNLRHYEDFWLDSVSSAVLIESLVKKMPASQRPSLGHAYLAGLLHNFGYLAISAILPPHFSILSRCQDANAHLPTELTEMHMLHFTREQIGAWLLRHWNLPDTIWMSIRYSKQPRYQGQHQQLAKLLYLSHQLLHNGSIESAILHDLGLTLEQAEDCRDTIYQQSTELHKIVALINQLNA